MTDHFLRISEHGTCMYQFKCSLGRGREGCFREHYVITLKELSFEETYIWEILGVRTMECTKPCLGKSVGNLHFG